MRLPTIAAAAAFAVLAGVVSAPAAQAAATTLHVRDIAACSDTGDGSVTTPFCTVQAAADVVEPGQVVNINSTRDQTVTITRSGTAEAPIVFEGGPVRRPSGSTSPTITVRGAHDVTLRGMTVQGATATDAVVIDGSSRVTLDRGTIRPDASPYSNANSVRVTGGSTDITVSRTTFETRGRAVYADGGARVTVTGNTITSLGNFGVIGENVDAFAVTGNTFRDSCLRAVVVTGGTTGSSIQNNVITEMLSSSVSSYCPKGPVHALEVDSAAAPGTTLDYNIIYMYGNLYRWAGTAYQTPATLQAATGQGAHDLQTDPNKGTPAVDSGNADAPGVLDLAVNGPRVDNPQVPNTGAGAVAYVDRGARELQDQLNSGSIQVSASQAPVGGAVSVSSSLSSVWKSPFTCAIDFGDGTTTSGSCSASHAYATTGDYTVKVTATSESRLTSSTSQPLKVVPAGGTLHPSLTVNNHGGMTVTFETDSGGSPWNIARSTFDFGDGETGTVTGGAGYHHYKRPGTYQVRATVTDAGGSTATAVTSYTTLSSGYVTHGPTRFLDTRAGIGAPGQKVAPYSTVRLSIGGRHGVPVDVAAVAMNLTVTNAEADGYLTAHPTGQAKPNASVVDFRAGGTVPGLTTVAVGGGHVDLYNGSPGTVDLIADVTGYFARVTTAEGFTAIDPSRLLDTRNGQGMVSPAPVVAGQVFSQRVGGHYTGGVPSHATAALLTVTVVDPRAPGHLTLYPFGEATPQTSNLNYTAGQTITNSVVAPLGPDGYLALYSNATTDVVIDVVGYFAPFGRSYLLPVAPFRAVDTRTGIGGPAGALPGRSNTQYPLDQGAPALSYTPDAVIFNAKVVNPRRDGFLTASHRDPAYFEPTSATLNFTPGAVTNNLAVTQSSRAGFYNGSDGELDLVVDVTGYFYGY
ncbi:PKD domain-containing protein [Actinosynnema sp. NPDC091369]